MKDIDLGKVSFIPRGTYDQTETYEWLDVVFSGPASYVSIRDENTNHPLTDPNYWMPLVDCRFILDYIRENGLEAAWIKVRDNATIGGKTIIRGGLDVGGDAHFYEDVQIDGKLTGVQIPGGGGGGGEIDGDSVETILEYLRKLNSELKNKLSRVDEDEAEGKIGFLQGLWIKARNLFWWDENGNIKANDIEGNDILGNEINANDVFATNSMKALKGFYNIIQSQNFTGHSQEDTGWILTNAYDGHSKLTVDEIYVRLKAVFEELEVRKWTYVGGNFILSAAGSRIVKVDYYDKEIITDDDEPLGYRSIDLPWGLVGQIFGAGTLADWIGKTGRYLGFWGAEKKIFVGLTPEEKASVKTFRCYLYTDDGTTQTMNWWQKGDQAKCQTFNQVTDKAEQDGSFSGRAANTYYWRLVTGVGTAKIDGRMYDYVDLSKETCDPSVTNDEPNVGDAIVQMGYRGADKTRQNMITLEVTGEDAPAIKEYMGIDSFSLEGKRRTMISPKSGNEFYATRFVIVTQYGDNRVPADRGLWVEIGREKGDYGETVRYSEDTADSDMVRKCYYYDRVAHNGAYWLCIAKEGSHWVDGSGHFITEEEYSHLSEEDKAMCQKKPDYTVLEPSDESPSAWQRHISAGIAPYLSLSSNVIPVNCEKDSTATEALTKDVTVRLKVTNLDCELSSVTVTPEDSHVSVQLTPGETTAKITFSYAAKETINVSDFVVTAKGKLNKQEYNDTDAISVYPVMKGEDAYTIFSTPDNMIYEQEGANLTYEQILEDLQKPEQQRTLTFNIITEDSASQSGYKEMVIQVLKDGVAQSFSIAKPIPSDNRITTGFDNPTKRVWIKYIPNTISMGYIDVPVTYGNNFIHTLRIPFYCNLMGTWRQMIVGDTDAAIATKTEFDYTDEQGNVQHINIRNFWAAYVRSSKETLTRFQSVEGTIDTLDGNLDTLNNSFGEFKQSAEGEFTTIKKDINTVNKTVSEHTTQIGKVVTTSGEFTTDFTQEVNSLIGTSVSSGDISTAIGNAKSDLENGVIKTNTTNIGKLRTGFNGLFGNYGDKDTIEVLEAEANVLAQIEEKNTEIATVQNAAKTLRSDLANVNSVFNTVSTLFTKYSISSTPRATYTDALARLMSLIDAIETSRDSIVDQNTKVVAGLIREFMNNFQVTLRGLNAEIVSREELKSDVTTVKTNMAELQATSEKLESKYNSVEGVLINREQDFYHAANWVHKQPNVSYSTWSSMLSGSDSSYFYSFVPLFECPALNSSGSRDSITITRSYSSETVYTYVYFFKADGTRKSYQSSTSTSSTISVPSDATHFGISVCIYRSGVTLKEFFDLDYSIVSGTSSTSLISQTAKNIRMEVEGTGIDISSGTIDLIAGKVNFKTSSGGTNPYISIDSSGKIKATDGEFSGKVTVSNGTNTVVMNSSGLQGRWSNDGISLTTNGLQRWHPDEEKWVNMFSSRYVKRVDKQNYLISVNDDFIISMSNNTVLTLPPGEDGKVLTIKTIGNVDIYPGKTSSGTKQLIITDQAIEGDYQPLNTFDRAEFVYFQGSWYWNVMGI